MARFAALLAFLVVLFAAAQVRAADAERGRKILEARCAACHSLDGAPKVGPTLRGAWGTERRVTSDGAERTARFDEAYLARALRDQNQRLREVFGFMAPRAKRAQVNEGNVRRRREFPNFVRMN